MIKNLSEKQTHADAYFRPLFLQMFVAWSTPWIIKNHGFTIVKQWFFKDAVHRAERPATSKLQMKTISDSVKKNKPNIFTKSGLMVGLGETKDEIMQVMDDLRTANVDFLTIGQYLQPSPKHYPLQRYYQPHEFVELKNIALSKGFLLVASSPLTRSSYHADEDFKKLKNARDEQTKCQTLQ